MSNLAFQADATSTAFDRAKARYLFALERSHSEPDHTDAAGTYTCDAIIAAENAVMAEQANTFEQLRAKFDILFCDLDSVPPTRHVLAVFADLVRLTGGKPSPVFNADRWLKQFERCGGAWVVRDNKPWLMWPEDERCDELLAELKARGGKPAVLDLILSVATQEA